ncbi:MAG: TonB-dependent receptor plug domain-containing protein [Sinimarinibacterium sp.]
MPFLLCPILMLPLAAAAQDANEAPQDKKAQAESPPDDAGLDELLGESDSPTGVEPEQANGASPAPAEPDASQPGDGEALDLIPVAKPAESPPGEAKRPPSPFIEEVVVTARRTAENMQDVPVAISAMSADDLRRDQINSASDLNGRVPSLVIHSNSQMRNTETPTIRGQGAQFGASAGVIVYIAEAPLPADPVANYQGGAGKFFDLSGVQILKGSQGTLFGRNTTGGALLLEPTQPQEEFGVSLRAGGAMLPGPDGEVSGQNYEVVLNLPLIGDTLLARLGGQFYQRDGFTDDVVTGKDYDSRHYWTSRLGLLWRPTDGVENYLLGHYADSKDNGTSVVIESINREGLNRVLAGAVGLPGVLPGLPPPADQGGTGCLLLNVFGPSTNCGQDILDEQAARGNRLVQLSADPVDNLDSGAVVDKFSFDLSDDLTLINIASYSTLKHQYRWDLDGSRAPFNDFTNPDDIPEAEVQTLTDELQLQGNGLDGALKFVLGAYYESTEASGRIVGTSLLFIDVDQRHEQSKRSLAPFAQGTYDLGQLWEPLSNLSLTLGARRTMDKTSGSAAFSQVAAGLFPISENAFEAEVENAEWTWTAGLDYKFDTHLVYGKLSRGYKAGGIAPIAVNPDHYTYAPEFVLNYELGHKSDFEFAGMPVRWNTAVYYTDYTDLQRGTIDAYVDPDNPSPTPKLGQAIVNVGQAWVAGLETDLTIQPFSGFTVLGSYGYTRAEYTDFSLLYQGATPQLDCTGQEIESGNVVDFSCTPFQTTPEHQFSLSGRYLLPLDPATGDVEASLTYLWTDRQFSGQAAPPEAEPGAWLPSFGLLNAGLSWRRMFGTALSAQLFGTNLTDEVHRIGNSNQWNLTYFQASMYSEPRVIGLSLSYDIE